MSHPRSNSFQQYRPSDWIVEGECCLSITLNWVHRIIELISGFLFLILQPQQQVKPLPANVQQTVCDKNKTTVIETKQKKVKTKKAKQEIVKPVRPVQMPKSIPPTHAQETKPQLIQQDDNKHIITTSRPPSTTSVCSSSTSSNQSTNQNHYSQPIAHNGPANSNVQIVRPSVAQNSVHVRNVNTSQCNTTPSNVNASSILSANNSIRMTSTAAQRSSHLTHPNQQHLPTGVISQANNIVSGTHVLHQQQQPSPQQQSQQNQPQQTIINTSQQAYQASVFQRKIFSPQLVQSLLERNVICEKKNRKSISRFTYRSHQWSLAS